MDNNTIRLRLKSPCRDGTESLLFTPSECIEKLIALVPIPRFHLTRYDDGGLASRSRHRGTLPDLPQPEDDQGASVTPLLRGKGKRNKWSKKRLTWAALLKRTFKIDVLTCSRCGGAMTLVHVALTPVEIETTPVALGLSPRAPPIAPARQIGVFGSFDDSPPEPWPSK